jgi:microcystin-dependent protein
VIKKNKPLVFFLTIKKTPNTMDEYLAIIKMFAGSFAPRGFAFCQGQLLAISSNNALFALLGTTYGGDGRTTFGLPNLSGRIPVGTGTGAGLKTVTLGETGGVEQISLTLANMPAHNHALTGSITFPVNDTQADATTPAGTYLADSPTPIYASSAGIDLGAPLNNTLQIGINGGSQAFALASPFMGMNYIICLEGLFPSRD